MIEIVDIAKVATSIWNFEVVRVDQKAITVSNLATGVLVTTIGFWAARRLSRHLAHKILKKWMITSI